MVGLTSEVSSPNAVLRESSGSCNCKSESVQGSANTDPLNPQNITFRKGVKTKNLSRKKSKYAKLSVFKGRETKLNHAILIIITQNSPQTIYDIAKTVRQLKGLTNTKYTNVNRRVKALEKQGFLEKAGFKHAIQGIQVTLFQPTTRAYVSLFLNQLDLDIFVKEADESTLIIELATLTLFFEMLTEKKIA